MKALFGLGNPGRRYEKTRHNIGFQVLHHFAKKNGIPLKKSPVLEAVWGKGLKDQEEVRLGLPQAYMNQSGKVVARCLKRWNLRPEAILVVVDDLQLPLGQLRIRPEGTDGGQKGLQSIIETLGTTRFPRLRIGIHSEPLKGPWEKFVLSPFNRHERPVVEETIEKATACCHLWIEKGIEACMNRFNTKGHS